MSSPDVRVAYRAWAGAVTLLTIADGRDDIGATISAFCPVSVDPPLVLISLMAESYLSELFLPRGDDPPAAEGIPGRAFAVTMLGAGQRMVAGRFAAEGRPSARLMLDDVPHHRGPISGALIPGEGLAAIECITEQRVPAGDHLLIVARVIAVAYVSDAGSPLIRFQGRYLLST